MLRSTVPKQQASGDEKKLPDFWVSGLDQSQIGQDGKPVERWVRMGAAWYKKDGKGDILVRVNSTPLAWNGAMLLQLPKDGDEK